MPPVSTAPGAHGLGRHVVVGDDLRAGDDLHAGSVVCVFFQFVIDESLVARQNDFEIGTFFHGVERAFYDLGGGVVAAHCVYDDFQHIFISPKRQ